ncbi:DUF4158 domain-containing protein [Paraburkholderia panacisoli]|uniref:DUF4158 domain-containing protein n=1 Tax=Paraburkholderia panacisoli TaxID=2603818 RepID=A0A5B0FWH9_9BURK|nr:DUF4158 domain-containing protein [Paraburkholderia panacisoli]
MEHWQVTYLGIRQIPRELTEFDLATFFTFSTKERALIEARRGELYRLAVALHIGFIRMSGRTLDAYKPGSQSALESPWRATGSRSTRSRHAADAV